MLGLQLVAGIVAGIGANLVAFLLKYYVEKWRNSDKEHHLKININGSEIFVDFDITHEDLAKLISKAKKEK